MLINSPTQTRVHLIVSEHKKLIENRVICKINLFSSLVISFLGF